MSRRARRNPAGGACRVSPTTRAALEREHTALHEGLPPSKITCEPLRVGVRPVPLGVATEIQYVKAIPGAKPDYHHPWKGYAQPTIGVDDRGRLHFATGRTEVRRRGIEDRVPAGRKASPYLAVGHVQPERWTRKAPSRLVTLGWLRFLRYNLGQHGPAGSTKTLRFTRATAPTLAHDQDGNLYALGGHYRLPLPGASPMARRRRRRSSSRHAFANPTHSVSRRRSTGSEIEKTGALAMTGLGVLAIAVPAAVVLDSLLANTTWSAGMKAWTKLAVGLGGFGVVSTFMPQNKLRPALAIGVLAGPGVDAGLDLYNLYLAQYVAQMMAPAQPAANPAVVVTPPAIGGAQPIVNAGAQALMPGAAPMGYAAYNPQACAVR